MLDINPLMMVVVFVVFLVLLVMLNRWFFGPMREFMEKRDRSIKNDLDSAKSNNDEVDALKQEADNVILQAKKEATAIREKALSETHHEIMEAVNAQKASLDRELTQFVQSLQEERKNLKNALLSQLPLYKESLKAKISQL